MAFLSETSSASGISKSPVIMLLGNNKSSMAYKNSYIGDIQNHFLFLIGRGIMLSPRDYDLIVKWKMRGVPKEIIYRGINKALENLKKRKGSDQFPRSLSECALSIEEEIRNYLSVKENKSSIELSRSDLIEKVAGRLAAIIKSEKREEIGKHYIEARKRVLGLMNSGKDIFKSLENIEQEFYEIFFQTLPQKEKERIEQMAEGLIDKKRKYLMTEKAHRESILSFRNEILRRDYELNNVFSYD
jgi:hypothetical protein